MNRCDLASAKLGLKATRQENDRLLLAARRQASRVRDLEVGQLEYGPAAVIIVGFRGTGVQILAGVLCYAQEVLLSLVSSPQVRELEL